MQIFSDFLNFSGFYLKVNHGAKGIPNAKKIPTKIKNRRVFGIQVSSATTIDKINIKYFFILIISL